MILLKDQTSDRMSNAQTITAVQYMYVVRGNYGSWCRLQVRGSDVEPWRFLPESHTRSEHEGLVEIPEGAAYVRCQLINCKNPSSITVELSKPPEPKGWWSRLLDRYSLASVK